MLGALLACLAALTVCNQSRVLAGMLCMLPSQCPTSSTLCPGTAPFHSYKSTTFTLLGAALHIVQSFAYSTFSLGGVSLCVHGAVPPYFHTFSGWGSSVCGYHSTLLLLQSLQERQPHMSTQYRPTISALSLDRVALKAGTIAF